MDHIGLTNLGILEKMLERIRVITMQLHEEFRPKNWHNVVAQAKVIDQINALRSRGLAGRAYWISGQSGTGKNHHCHAAGLRSRRPVLHYRT